MPQHDIRVEQHIRVISCGDRDRPVLWVQRADGALAEPAAAVNLAMPLGQDGAFIMGHILTLREGESVSALPDSRVRPYTRGVPEQEEGELRERQELCAH